jgi:hypothetical protein
MAEAYSIIDDFLWLAARIHLAIHPAAPKLDGFNKEVTSHK